MQKSQGADSQLGHQADTLSVEIHALFHGSDGGCAYGGLSCPARSRLITLLQSSTDLATRANKVTTVHPDELLLQSCVRCGLYVVIGEVSEAFRAPSGSDRDEAIKYLESIGVATDEERVLLAQFLATQPTVKQINLCTSLAIQQRGKSDAASAGAVDVRAAIERAAEWLVETYVTSTPALARKNIVERIERELRSAGETDAKV